MRGGQALRGSSELHAWGDSNLYLRRRGDTIHLNIEHRAAASPDDLRLEINAGHDILALQISSSTPPATPRSTARQRIEQALAQATAPLSQRELRAIAGAGAETVGQILNALIHEGNVNHSPKGYELNRSPVSVSHPGQALTETETGNTVSIHKTITKLDHRNIE